MEKLLFIHILNTKQKENNKKPSKVLNISFSILFILLILIFTGPETLGFLKAEKINGIDIIGILGVTYGILNLIYSLNLEEEKQQKQNINTEEKTPIKKYEYTILPKIYYKTGNELPINKPEVKENTIEKKPLIDESETIIQSETPVEALEEQLKAIEQDTVIYEDVPTDALTVDDRKKGLENFLEQIL